MSTFNVQQFLTAVKTVALKAETFSECDQLIEWTLANLPYVGQGEADFSLFKALDDICRYWNEYGCAEDELLPALSIVHTFFAYGHNVEGDLELLLQRIKRCDEMLAEPNLEESWMSYEEFCDKHAAVLNN